MKRNMKKTIDQGQKIIRQNVRFDMTLSEFEELVQGSYSGAKNYNDVLYKASRNERLRNIINNLREQITVIRGVSMRYPGRLKDTQDEHRRLVECISARNVEKSQEMARIHLENAEKTLMAAMSERKDGGDISKLAEKKES